ncbi:hypothetical protein [Actinomycetospora flava]|uniref:Membrane-associated oxidoreductase n=1 Tax=Actinomycetospora flava TaxID=3129232 RepID=A0ABU8MG57_9PSEU
MSTRDTLLDFEDLRANERELVNNAQTGSWWSGPNQTFGPPSRGPLTAERAVRAQVIYQLLTGHGELSRNAQDEVVSVRAVRLMSATIVGHLDLRGSNMRCPLELVACSIEDSENPCDFRQASGPYLRLTKCRLPRGLEARHLNIRGDLDLSGCEAFKKVNLDQAQVGGSLYFTGAKLLGRDDVTLSAAEAAINGSMFLDSGFSSVGEVRLLGAQLGQSLELSGGQFLNAGGNALNADRILIEGGVFARRGLQAEGTLNFDLAKIAGIVNSSDSEVWNEGGTAVSFEGATVGGDMMLRTGVELWGGLVARSCSIRGSLNLNGAKIVHPGMCAVDADNIEVDRGAFLRSGFTAEGEVRLLSASIGKLLSFDGGHLKNVGNNALTADHLSVDGSFHFRSEARAEGRIRLWGCQIAGSVEFNGSTVSAADTAAIILEQSDIKGALRILPASLEGLVDLRSAQVNVIVDSGLSRKTRTLLRGCRYESLIPEPPRVGVRERLDWLRLDPEGYSSQPYSHLASEYQKKGYGVARRRTLIEAQKIERSRHSGIRGLVVPAWSLVLRATVGYGYQPWLAVVWLAAILSCGSVAVEILHKRSSQDFVPAASAPDFNSFLYATDTLLPFIDFGYNRWTPHGLGQVASVLLVVVGWVFATILLAAFAGVLRRGD